MPAPLAVDKEQVRMLVLAVGVREAARQLGIKEATVQDWSATGKWLAQTRSIPAIIAAPVYSGRPTNPTKPADALQKVLVERQNHTKLGLSLFTARAARAASRLPKEALLANAADVKAVADIASKVWPEQAADHSLHLSFFRLSAEREEAAVERPVIDVEQA